MLGSLSRILDANLLDTRGLLRRWWFWAGTLFMLSAIAVGYVVIPFDGSRTSQANCDKIELGWTMEQVRDLLGFPNFGEFYATVDWIYRDEDGNWITISFHRRTGVIDKSFIPSRLSMLERIKKRIERRLHISLP